MPWQVAKTGAQIILSNTYHLMLRRAQTELKSWGRTQINGLGGPFIDRLRRVSGDVAWPFAQN